ncbi:LacI family DNA-binding transcriptional regulator [Halalkalibacter oceani]|uniref:LacI family DNA-binding transcriptional regulator n=1 Tax=Halalkalibacter oceani TaxID=1653776 RepID=UPI003390E86B
MKITMKTIAQEAGVSVTTVSHVINGTKKISAEKHKIITDLIKKYNYVPNSMAQSLRNHSTKTAGLVVSSFPDSHVTNIVNGIGRRAQEAGYNLLFVNTNENEEYERETIHLLHSKMVDGLILSPTSSNLTYLQKLIDKQFPIVFVNRYDTLYDQIPRVGANNYQAGFDATTHLIKHGHQEIGLVCGLRKNYITTTEERIKGYKEALLKHNLHVNEDYLVATNATVEGGKRATKALLAKHPQLTALFCVNDLTTIGAIEALHEMELACPEDVAVIGCGDFEAASIIDPPVTTVRLAPETIGITAFDALLSKINNNDYCQHIELPTSLLIRKSCGC